MSLITDILDVSKVEAGEMDLHETAIDVADMIAGCETLVRDLVTAKDIDLSIETAPKIGQVRADARLLRQIVLNLLTNAVKFTAPGGTIGVTAGLTGEGAVEITISDNGCGIREEDLDRVLEPFGQVRSHPQISHGGTGLGLPLAKRFTELHGGIMSLDSTLGVGTTVRVTMPAHRTLS